MTELQSGAKPSGSRQPIRRSSNLRTALVLAMIALAFFAVAIANRWMYAGT